MTLFQKAISIPYSTVGYYFCTFTSEFIFISVFIIVVIACIIITVIDFHDLSDFNQSSLERLWFLTMISPLNSLCKYHDSSVRMSLSSIWLDIILYYREVKYVECMFVFHFIAIFGRPLELTLAYETKKDKNRKVPELVQMCVEFLQANGLEMEGIFR